MSEQIDRSPKDRIVLENNRFKICGNCKWMNQGEGSCHCFNPKQTDKDLIGYVYYNFDCKLFKEGERPTKKEMKAMGYDYVKGENGWWCYIKSDSIQTPQEIK